jgi:excinuclease ABC subunit C
MKDARGDVVYVGKAQSLRSRVRSYWQKQTPTGEIHRIRSVIDRVVDVEVTQTDSVSEALLLEANLIKRYRPRFNVRLKDDKSYPYIKVTLGDEFPRVERTRKLVNDGSRYFGPYASASSVDESMNLVRGSSRSGPARSTSRTGSVPSSVRASSTTSSAARARASTAISRDDYPEGHRAGRAFPRGSPGDAVKALGTEMAGAAERTDYERAAVLRDKIRAIERTMESQKMAAFRPDRAGHARSGPPGQPGGQSSCSSSATGR